MDNFVFWEKLKRPFIILAPMADVTDAVFRSIIAEQKAPDVMFTEFVSADGLMHENGRKRLLIDLLYSSSERPVVAQIFSGKPEKIEGAAALCRELGFDGVDVNMGCPDRSVEKQGAGAALIKDRKRAQDIVVAAKRGAYPIPVSVKTRLGYKNVDELESWLNALLETELANITVHLRTREEMSKVNAHWELATELIRLRDKKGVATFITANGDTKDVIDARQKAQTNKIDGVMLGRAIFGNPWLFTNRDRGEIPFPEKMRVMLEHTRRFEEQYNGIKNFQIMRKFYTSYIEGHSRAKEFRSALMTTKNYTEVYQAVKKFVPEVE